MTPISRRRFIIVAGGAAVAGCAGSRASDSSSRAADPGGTSTVPPSSVVTTTTVPSALVPDDRVLVIVELTGGNDAINTLPPTIGAYHDLRPTLSLPDDTLVSAGFDGHALHPALAPMVPMIEAGVLGVVAGIGWDQPDRSHFASLDRWNRADRVAEPYGWVGRWLDTLDADPSALGAVGLGSTNDLMKGAQRGATLIAAAEAFGFPAGLSNADIRRLTDPTSDDPLLAAAQRAFGDAVGAVSEFDPIADAVRSAAGDQGAGYQGAGVAGAGVEGAGVEGNGLALSGGTFSTGLAVAAELILSDVETKVVSISGSGFDTHARQLEIHGELLADLAAGLATFWATLEAAGQADRVLLVTTSEFGRRATENGSGGCDHGAAGVSFVLGRGIAPGLHGAVDLTDLLDGDLRPSIDPRAMFTGCLDWLGGDVERVLGDRYDTGVSLFA